MTLKSSLYKGDGKIAYTNSTGATITAGTPISVAGRVGIPANDIAAGMSDELDVTGRFRVARKAEAWDDGDTIGWDADGNPVGGTAGSGAYTNVPADMDFVAGSADAAAATTDEVGLLRLNHFASAAMLDAIPAQAHIADVAAITADDPAAMTYDAPEGGATTDAEARASLAQLAADVTAIRAEVIKLVADVTADKAKIDAILVALETAAIVASA
jgi:predicted RecA/RadA family phage recombinase